MRDENCIFALGKRRSFQERVVSYSFVSVFAFRHQVKFLNLTFEFFRVMHNPLMRGFQNVLSFVHFVYYRLFLTVYGLIDQYAFLYFTFYLQT